ncbi:MAG TPA: hypothetical protein VF269_07780 [Rhodanobacteraceae bacterium]
MTTKRKSKPKASGKNTVVASTEPGQSREAVMSRLAVEPCMTAAAVSIAYTEATFGEQDITETHKALIEQTKRVHDGNMREVESTLMAQATALNSMFTSLARRAVKQEYLTQLQAHMKLALRAQNQCRMTLETLATIKNPPVVFAKQANIANGPQQVNNATRAPAQEMPNPPNQLLEAPHAKPEWMDATTTCTPAPSHQGMEAVGTVNRATHASRQGHSEP